MEEGDPSIKRHPIKERHQQHVSEPWNILVSTLFVDKEEAPVVCQEGSTIEQY